MENGLNLQSVLNTFVIWNIWWSLTRLTVESFEIILIINICLENLLGLAGSQAICVGATRGSKPDVLCAAWPDFLPLLTHRMGHRFFCLGEVPAWYKLKSGNMVTHLWWANEWEGKRKGSTIRSSWPDFFQQRMGHLCLNPGTPLWLI